MKGVLGQPTVSRASLKDDGTLAPAGSRGSCGALFCTSKAICAILRSEDDEASCPKETEWNESGLLAFASSVALEGNARDGDQRTLGARHRDRRHISPHPSHGPRRPTRKS